MTELPPPLWPSAFDRDQLADLLGTSSRRVKEWTRRGVLETMEPGRYYRDEAVVGVILAYLQEALGEKSGLAFEIARGLRPRLRGFLRWGEHSPVPGPLHFTVRDTSLPESFALRIEIPVGAFEALVERLDEMAGAA
jgi:hypothetical protein